jgi:hypothetical protein
MTMNYILNADGHPVPCDDPLAWALWMETAERRLLQDLDEGLNGPDDPKRVLVSTVFLGLDHNYFSDGPPILWETMVFGGVLDGTQQRYASREEAIVGHQELCCRVMETIHR